MITTYAQLIQEINECAALWHREDEGENLENIEMLSGIEFDVARAITEYALSKGLDYDIGRFKLSFIYHADSEDPQYDVLEDCRSELMMTFVEMIIDHNYVIDDHPLENKYQPIKDPDPELVAAAKHFYKSFWPDYDE
ncbi:MAG: hypothetical protein R2774_15625 [Saprospiraceae bacterium]